MSFLRPTLIVAIIATIANAMSLESPAAGAPELSREFIATEKQITRGPVRQAQGTPGGRILTNTGVWSPDGQWIVYDVRSDADGDVFDGARIEMVNVDTGEVRVLFESARGAHCGVATFHPVQPRVAFILGPENPTPEWSYSISHRQGVIVDVAQPRVARNLDARDLTVPFTPGALRGGTHVHVWDARGEWLSFTYNDALFETDLRDVGVSLPQRSVRVTKDHERNHDGMYFSLLVTRTTAHPKPGSDEIQRACEEGWIGTNGYARANSTRQKHALAFQGHVVTPAGSFIAEVFAVDLPDNLPWNDVSVPAAIQERPQPPPEIVQRRLTFTAERKYPGLQGPRHWLRSSPDGSRIAFLMRDDHGIAQLWTVSPNGGAPVQLTRNPWPIASAFTWSRDGKLIAHVLDQSVAVTDTKTGVTHRLTPRGETSAAPRFQACVFSPDGHRLAYVRRVKENDTEANQIFVLDVKRR